MRNVFVRSHVHMEMKWKLKRKLKCLHTSVLHIRPLYGLDSALTTHISPCLRQQELTTEIKFCWSSAFFLFFQEAWALNHLSTLIPDRTECCPIIPVVFPDSGWFLHLVFFISRCWPAADAVDFVAVHQLNHWLIDSGVTSGCWTKIRGCRVEKWNLRLQTVVNNKFSVCSCLSVPSCSSLDQVGLVYMFNLIVGTGALTMPKAFATAGWVVSLALISFLGFMR